MTTIKAIDCFKGDTMAADVWADKYAMKNKEGIQVEQLPKQMHRRMAKEFARIEWSYVKPENLATMDKVRDLSEFGEDLLYKRNIQSEQDIEDEIFSYFDKFSRIVPQGSIMSNLGNPYVFGSVSNCFGIGSPYDSYGGILKTDQELVQLMKRRGGVGMTLDTLRPSGTSTSNAAKSSTGVPSFAERFSNSTREVAQGGRRGALMLLLSCKHPDIFKFVTMKDDRTKVTGANVSVMFTDGFMKAVEKDGDFICTFPVDANINLKANYNIYEYNKIYTESNNSTSISFMKIHTKELFDLVVDMAHKNAEPGVAFIDRVKDYCPDGVYEIYAPTVCNPCGEQWFSADETCRLIAQNFFTIVDDPFTPDAKVNLERLYEQSYMQQRLGDDLVDLEVEYIDRILEKIMSDPEPMEIKEVELKLWSRIKFKAQEGRRTGGGFTGLGDMLAALDLKYDSDEALQITEIVMKTKMEAELDATIDMAILRGTFTGWNRDKEFEWIDKGNGNFCMNGVNSFYTMLIQDFTEQAVRMQKYGRRNVSWSTVAPTGTVSLMTQTTSGLEPLFKAYYIRRKKINPSESGSRVDFVDQNGDTWMEYAVLHPKFKEWIVETKLDGFQTISSDEWSKEAVEQCFKQSPWYGSEADDISWEKRVLMQSIIQKYTSNAISSTINLPKDVDKSVVANIYMTAWKSGLKGVTVYRDGSRTGVLVNETNKVIRDEFDYTNAPKRPKELEAHYYWGKNGHEYAIIVGLLNGKPYEIFAFANPLMTCELKGKIIKNKQGQYSFISNSYTIEHLELSSDHKDEILLTRMASQLLRHGVHPRYVVEQVNKCQLNIVSFPKIISRILKKYIPDEETKEKCSNCGNTTMIYEEGCKKCSSCGYSKC